MATKLLVQVHHKIQKEKKKGKIKREKKRKIKREKKKKERLKEKRVLALECITDSFI